MKRELIRVVLFLVFTLSLLAPGIIQAQPTCTLQLDRDEATLDDIIRLSVKCEGKVDGAPSGIAGLQDFMVNSSGTSTQIQIVNGSMSKVTEYTYLIQARKPGTFTIGPARITSGGKAFLSNTLRLNIAGQAQTAPATGAQGKPVFLKATLSAHEAFPDEQLTYTLRFFYRTRISDVSLADVPQSKDITLLQQGEQKEYQTTVGGLDYQVIELRYQLTAPKPGAYTIDPARLRMTMYGNAQRRQRGVFDDPFFGMAQGRPVTVASEALRLKVNPLPVAGRPQGFTGLIGTFQAHARLTPSQIKTGETATLSVRIEGVGNIKNIPDLSLPDINGLKIYADQPRLESTAGSSGMSGSKTMQWALVAQTPGAYSIPSSAVTWFDPKEKRYVTQATTPLSLTVLPGNQAPGASVMTPGAQPALQPAKSEVALLGKDILPVHTALQALRPGLNLTRRPVICFVILLLPPLIFAGLLLMRNGHWAKLQESPAVKARRALKNCTATLRQEELSANAVLEALRDFINTRFSQNMGLITPGEVSHVLQDHKTSQERVSQFAAIITALQQAVYTGEGDNPAHVDRESLIKLLHALDKEAV